MPLPRLVIDLMLHCSRPKTFSLPMPQGVQPLEGQTFDTIKIIILIELLRLPRALGRRNPSVNRSTEPVLSFQTTSRTVMDPRHPPSERGVLGSTLLLLSIAGGHPFEGFDPPTIPQSPFLQVASPLFEHLKATLLLLRRS